MKKVLLFSALIFLLTPKVLAQIKEGKSTVNTKVTTNVNTSSNTSSDNKSETKTHIEIEVNGEKKVLDTSEPGTHTLSIEKDGGKSSATVKITGDTSNNNDPDKNDGPGDSLDDNGKVEDTDEIIEKINEENRTIIQRIIDEIKNFFEKLFDY